MSMSSFVLGIVPPDDKWLQMKKIADACDAADIDRPSEVDDFFEGEDPDPAGMIIDIENLCREWGEESSMGYELDVAAIPKKVKTIRFYNSW